jgi:hypothetical protein
LCECSEQHTSSFAAASTTLSTFDSEKPLINDKDLKAIRY